MTKKTQITVETLAGTKYLDLYVKDGAVYEVTVNMGAPAFEASKIPVISGESETKNSKIPVICGTGEEENSKISAGSGADEAEVIDQPILVKDREFFMTAVSMGNPHTVVFVEDTASFPIETYGPAFEHHARFPERVNTEFVQLLDRSNVNMRVWERGSGETHACGTGACATAMACIKNGHTGSEVTVHMLGGDLRIRYDADQNLVFMTGPAVTTFEGEFFV